jgi:glycosyltransferase involved in cell wall biosynthesis
LKWHWLYVISDAPKRRVISYIGHDTDKWVLDNKIPAVYIRGIEWGDLYTDKNRWITLNREICKFGRLVIAANTPEEFSAFHDYGLTATVASNNCFVNENVFKLSERRWNTLPKYDAVYIAQLMAFKRHALAADIFNLYVVCYGKQFKLHDFCPDLIHAGHNTAWLSEAAVVSKLHDSRVGLALSRLEGANLATVEYGLCGLPVVSTPSKGGRDLFFNQFTKIVDPEPLAVSKAVEELAVGSQNPFEIRMQTLKTIWEHRQSFATVVGYALRRDDYAELAQELFVGGFDRLRVRPDVYRPLENTCSDRVRRLLL